MKKILLSCLTALLLGSSAQANIVYVNISATGSNDGSSWTDAYTNLQEAILSSQPNDELWVAQGTYVPDRDNTGNLNPSDDSNRAFYLSQDLQLYGGFIGIETQLSQRDVEVNETILSGYQGAPLGTPIYSYRVVDQVISLGSGFLLDGFTIQDANNTIGGTGVGGGLSVYDCIGGKIQNCTFTDNIANTAGALRAVGSEIYVWNCKFQNNTSNDIAGAIYANGSYLDIRNCIFQNNEAHYGAGIAYQGTPNVSSVIGKHILSNCLFYENTSTVYGGSAVFAYNTTPVYVYNCTFNQNIEPGGGNAGQGVIRSNGVAIEIRNSIVWEDNGLIESNSTPLFTVSDCIIKDGTTVVFANSTNVSDIDPIFNDSLLYDFTLNSNSPGINTGDTTGCSQYLPMQDIAGNNRYTNAIDLGCYEYFCAVTIDTAISYSEQGGLQYLDVPSSPTATYEWVDCNNNYATIVPSASGTNQWNVNQIGNYACIIVDGCAADTSACYNVDYILGISEQASPSLEVFPNPVQNILHIADQPGKVSIYTLSGSIVSRTENNTKTIDVSALEAGVYIISLQTDQGLLTSRFIKQ